MVIDNTSWYSYILLSASRTVYDFTRHRIVIEVNEIEKNKIEKNREQIACMVSFVSFDIFFVSLLLVRIIISDENVKTVGRTAWTGLMRPAQNPNDINLQ